MKAAEMNIWRRRLNRFHRSAAIALMNNRHAWSWQVLGGKRFYGRYLHEIAASHPWCFIVGCNNSGTTLLHDLLAKAPDVSALRHEGQVYTRAIPRAERRGHERVWSEFLDELRLDASDSFAAAPRLIHDWMRAYHPRPKNWLLEKTTANAVRMPWLQEIFPTAHFIAVVRNGYAVSEGIKRKGHKEVGRAAKHWAAVNQIVLRDAAVLGRFLLVRYEDITRKPDQTLQRICQFLGWSDYCIDFSRSMRDQNPRSFARLTSSEVETIRREAEVLLDEFGYSIPKTGNTDKPDKNPMTSRLNPDNQS